MTLESIISVVSILLAVMGIAYSSKERILLYKFSIVDMWICILYILTVSYLLMFDIVQSHGLCIEGFIHEGNSFPLPSEWAYIVTIFFVGHIIIKSFVYKSVPKSRVKGLISYYEELIYSDTPLLITYMRRYHQKSLKKYLEKQEASFVKLHNKESETTSPWEHDNIDKYFSYGNKKNIESLLFSNIILSPSFITETISHHNPSFFLEIVSEFPKGKDIYGFKNGVDLYIRTLLRARNTFITDAINGTNNILFEDKRNVAYRITDYPFSKLIFGHLDFTCELGVWKSFGEEGMRIAQMDSIFQKNRMEWLDDDYNKTPARMCLSFYDILIRQILYMEYNHQVKEGLYIYPYYLYLICESALENTHQIGYEGLYVQKLIDDTKCVIFNLIKCLAQMNIKTFLEDLLKIINSLLKMPSLPMQEKVSIAKWYIEMFLDLGCENFVGSFRKCMENKSLPKNIMQEGLQKVDIKYQKYDRCKELKEIFK